MNEVLPEIPIKRVSRKELMTELGVVAKVEVVFNGSPFTVYYTGPTDIGLQECIEDIVSAEKAAKSPIVVGIGEEKTPEEFIEYASNEFIEKLRANNYSSEPKGRQSALDPLVKQRAMKKLFDEAEKKLIKPS